MKILLKSTKIVDPQSDFGEQRKNILIEDGVIKSVSNETFKADIVIENKCVSIGWFDLRSFIGDPGFEFKEDFTTGFNAAVAGGFSDIVLLPNSNPVVQSKGAIEYIKNRSKGSILNVYPTGAVSIDTTGEQLCELHDMQSAGAIGFTDGIEPIWHSSVLLKALQYVQNFEGIIFEQPRDKYLSKGGVVNEGLESVKVGLKGLPALAESIAITKALDILRYTGGKIHFSCISTAAGVKLIRNAKKEGLLVTSDVASYQLVLTDKDAMGFDANFKVMPPLRTEKENKELIKGIKDGTIDCIVSNHIPQDADGKNVEFDQAEFGMINYETSFSHLFTALQSSLSLTQMIELISTKPRKVLKLPIPKIKKGEQACLTVFDPELKWTPSRVTLKSKSLNSPFLNKELTGRAVAVINKNQIYINE